MLYGTVMISVHSNLALSYSCVSKEVNSPDHPACYFSLLGFPLAPQVRAMQYQYPGREFVKNHPGHLSLGSLISSFSRYSVLQFRINFHHFFQLLNRHFWCHHSSWPHHITTHHPLQGHSSIINIIEFT